MMKPIWHSTSIAICLFLTLSFAVGCGGKRETTKKEDDKKGGDGNTEKKQPKWEDDVLLRVYASDPNTINLLNSNDNQSTAFQRRVYEQFAERKLGEPETWVPKLAESWEFDEENLEFTLHLRKGVMWHPITFPNGEVVKDKEFTAADVEFTYQCIFNPHTEAATIRSYLAPTDKETGKSKPRVVVTVVDDYTVKIRWLEKYFQADEYTLTVQPIPRHVYALDKDQQLISLDFNSQEFGEAFNEHWANRTMCGTGPLIFEEWDKGEEVTLRRNDNYWGDLYPFSKVVYQYITNDETVRQKGFKGELDLFAFRQADHYVDAKDREQVKNGDVSLLDYPMTGYRYLGYNLNRDIFKDKRVRTAMSHATPVDDIIRDLYKGYANRVTGPFAPGQFSDPNIKPIPFDIEKARELMSEAGWEDTNGDGVRNKEIDGKTVEFEFDLMIYADSQTYASIAQLVQSNFKKIGVKVNISPAKWALMLEKLLARDFDATILGWSADWKSDPYQIWHGNEADVDKSSNHTAYSNPEVDKLIDELRVTMDEEKQIPLYHEIHRLIFEDQPYTFLYSDKAMAGYDSRLENVRAYPGLRPFLEDREWESSKARVLGE